MTPTQSGTVERPKIIQCDIGGSLKTDYCQADAARDSLREHMKLLTNAHKKIDELNTTIKEQRQVLGRYMQREIDSQELIKSLRWELEYFRQGRTTNCGDCGGEGCPTCISDEPIPEATSEGES